MKLTIRDCGMDDWWVIERAEHDGRVWLEKTGPNSSALRMSCRFSDADVEGTSYEMRALAQAIRERGEDSFRRCAVRVVGDKVFFCSPRNSSKEGECTLAEADDLAALIERTVPEKEQ